MGGRGSASNGHNDEEELEFNTPEEDTGIDSFMPLPQNVFEAQELEPETTAVDYLQSSEFGATTNPIENSFFNNLEQGSTTRAEETLMSLDRLPATISLPSTTGMIQLTDPTRLSSEGVTAKEFVLANEVHFSFYSELEKINQISEDLIGFKLAPEHYAELVNAPPNAIIQVVTFGQSALYLDVSHPELGDFEAYLKRDESGRLSLEVENHSTTYPIVAGADYSDSRVTDNDDEEIYSGSGLELASYSGSDDFYRDRGSGLEANNPDDCAGIQFADATILEAYEVTKLNELSKELFGYSFDAKDYTDVIAAPPGAIVVVQIESDSTLYFTVEHPLFEVLEAKIHRTDLMELEAFNGVIRVAPDAPKGTGTERLRNGVNAYTRYGLERISALAAGDASTRTDERGEGWVGYMVWGKMGFNGKLTDEIRAKLPAKLAKAGNLQQLIALPGGKKWWEKNGENLAVTFDLAKDSDSRRQFNSYLAKKGLEGLENE
jgi:hypothetical protein